MQARGVASGSRIYKGRSPIWWKREYGRGCMMCTTNFNLNHLCEVISGAFLLCCRREG